jgi:glycosyltransferase involved in cell wall biosynthesis
VSIAAPRRVAIVTGDFVKTGGMDRANYALADYLGRAGTAVRLVAHRAAPELLLHPTVEFDRVPKPFGSYTLGEPLLDFAGRRAARDARRAGGLAVVNGGNCLEGPVNWVHYVHAGFRQPPEGFSPRNLRIRLHTANARRRERAALALARLVLTNSAATRRAVVELGVPPERAFVVYYGIDGRQFAPSDAVQASDARRELGWPDRPTVAFVGALGDRRKGFDTLFAAWQELCRESSWDADVVAVGTGASLPAWRERAVAAGLEGRVRFLGFRSDVERVLGACDAIVAPARYEAFGLAVAEALARGLPAIVSSAAGVAELYPEELRDLTLQDPESVAELKAVLVRWRAALDIQRERVRGVSERLRTRSWDHMAREIVGLMNEHAL